MEENNNIELQTFLENLLNENPELKQYADFSISKNNIGYIFTLDVTKYKVSFKNHFFELNNPENENAKFIDNFYSDLYNYVCDNLPSDYIIDCWNNEYIAIERKKVDEYRLSTMTKEEQKIYTNNKIENEKLLQRGKRNYLLKTEIDPIFINSLRVEDLSEDEKVILVNYRQYLLTYPDKKNWWKKEPLTFEDWKKEVNK